MAQYFIVEGKDGYVLSAICEKAGLGIPVGYTSRTYKNFVIRAGGFANISEALRTALEDNDATNIGVVVDANDVGVKSRYGSITNVVRKTLQVDGFTMTPNAAGWVATVKQDLVFGLWVMPDNASKGYLEHFLGELVNKENVDYQRALGLLAEIGDSGTASFSKKDEQKALIALFLAIQEEPGMNPQTAVQKGILDHRRPLAETFTTWFARTFELS